MLQLQMIVLEKQRLIEPEQILKEPLGPRVHISSETTKSMVSRVHSGAGM